MITRGIKLFVTNILLMFMVTQNLARAAKDDEEGLTDGTMSESLAICQNII